LGVTSAGDGPSVTAVIPRLRFGRRWFNLIWTLPLAAFAFAVIIAVCIALRTTPAVQAFIEQYPGSVPNDAPEGFPVWLRWQHFLNAIFLVPIVRAGIQLWAGRPRLYWRAPAAKGRDWLRIQRAMPAENGWAMRDDAVGLHPQLGLPGKRLSGGLAHWWHLAVTFLWVVNGILFYVLIFVTGQWMRIVPTSWDVFPHALSAVIQYGSLDFPTQDSWVAYNGVQLLTYFITVFIAAPLAVITGILHAPSMAKRFAGSRFLNVEVVRSVHVLVLAYFIVFVIAHVSLVLLTGATANLNHITLGTQDSGWAGFTLFAIAVVVGGVVWALLSPLTLRFPNAVQKTGAKLLGPIGRWF
jgi:methionine sulfoxide reductase catalytic subunit